jgi:outer membrane cobalamin receptor
MLLMAFFILQFSNFGYAQKVHGTVLDSSSQEAIMYANIVLCKSTDTSFVQGTTSDLQGAFEMPAKAGSYILKISVVGYHDFVTQVIKVEKESYDFGRILLVSTQTQLDAVVISAEKSFIEYVPGKQVINLKQDIANGGGNVTNIVRMVPAVEITPSGELTIRGNQDVQILINGRVPAYGVKPETLLKQIPVSSVERIEVITNASAKDDPENGGGAINIILKENAEDGFNVAVNAEGGMAPFRGNVGAAMNWRKGKSNTYINYAYYMEKYHFENNDATHFKNEVNLFSSTHNRGSGDDLDKGHLLMGGFSYDISSQQKLNIEMMYNRYQNHWTYSSDNTYRLLDGLGDYTSTLTNNSNDDIQFANAALNYDLKGKRNMLLQGTGNFSFGTILSKRIIGELSADHTQDYTLQNQSNGNFQVADLALDFSRDVFKNATIEAGVKTDWIRYVDNQQLSGQQNKLLQYRFQQHRIAMYGIYTQKIGAFSTSVGLRPEKYYSIAKGNEFKQDIVQDYLSFFPNLKLQYKFKKKKSLSTINLAYAKKIRRPDDEELDPAINYENPKHLRQGNIELKPEFIHSVELGFTHNHKSTKVYATLFATQVNNVIQEYTTIRSEEVLFTTYRNHSQSRNIGIDITTGFKPIKWWECMPSGTFMLSRYAPPADPATPYHQNGRMWNVKVNNMIEINPINNLQVILQYNGTMQSAFMKRAAYHQMNLGYEREILAGIGSLTISVNDVFNTGGREYYDFMGKNLESKSDWRINSRFVNLGISIFIK